MSWHPEVQVTSNGCSVNKCFGTESPHNHVTCLKDRMSIKLRSKTTSPQKGVRSVGRASREPLSLGTWAWLQVLRSFSVAGSVTAPHLKDPGSTPYHHLTPALVSPEISAGTYCLPSTGETIVNKTAKTWPHGVHSPLSKIDTKKMITYRIRNHVNGLSFLNHKSGCIHLLMEKSS